MRRGLATQSPATLNEPRKRRRKSSHGFPGVRGGQGRGRDQFQGCLPYKEKVTDLCDTPEEAYAALQILEKEKREAEQKVPDYGWGLQPLPAAASSFAFGTSDACCWQQMPLVGIGRSMWPLPVGSNPNSHGCEVVVAQLLRA